MFKKIVLASNNPGKLAEFSKLLGPLGMEVVPQAALNIPEAEEPYFTFIENALTKARHAARLSGLPALSDDSGLCVDVLGGAPGVFSARYAGEPKSDQRNNAALLTALTGETNRRAHYVCVLVLVRDAHDPQPLIGLGRWHGQIVTTPRGQNGFGYDSLFLLPERGLTAAEIEPAYKNQISHRAIALKSLLDQMREFTARP